MMILELLSRALSVLFVLFGVVLLVGLGRRVGVRAIVRRGIPNAGGPLLYGNDYQIVLLGIFELGLGVSRLVPAISGLFTCVVVLSASAVLAKYWRRTFHGVGREVWFFIMGMLGLLASFALLFSIGILLSGDTDAGAALLIAELSLLLVLGIVVVVRRKRLMRIGR